MRLRTLLLTTIALWAMAIAFLGYRRMFVTWHWGSGATFFFRSLPLSVLIVAVLLVLETVLFRWLGDRFRRP